MGVLVFYPLTSVEVSLDLIAVSADVGSYSRSGGGRAPSTIITDSRRRTILVYLCLSGGLYGYDTHSASRLLVLLQWRSRGTCGVTTLGVVLT
jgi:hypothetical protein